MCGIAGYISRSSPPAGALTRALASMAHRGPDGDGEWRETRPDGVSVWLGHRRLSIIDLSNAASQPMADSSGRYQLTYNGEIYNYLELRSELIALGVHFQSVSDSEVLLEAFKRWGTRCLDRFNGMFAFAIYDRVTGTLFCARDRFAEKPLLYCAKRGVFAFASEYKAMLQLPAISAGCDEFRLVQAACNPGRGLDAERQTVFNDIRQLLPGEALELDASTLTPRVWRYYRPKADASRWTGNEADSFAEFRELLIDSVRLRLRSDVTVGSCLSGGLDSSSIVCIARNILGQDARYHTFTGQFPGTYADEMQFAQVVVDHTGVLNHTVEPTAGRFADELPRFMWMNELPVGSSSQFAQWCVFDLARQHGVTVLLDGQGADELLGGYPTYFKDYIQSLDELGDAARKSRDLALIALRYPDALASPLRDLRDRLPFRLRHALANRLGLGTSLYYGLQPDIAIKAAQTAQRQRLEGFCALTNTLAQDSFGGFLTTLLRYGDRNSMAHSREVRLPFCDHRLADLALSLPPQLLMGEGQNKRILRESMRGILPEAIRTRWQKQGFRPPQDLWFKSPRMLALVRDTFASASFRQSPFWIATTWDKLLDRVTKGETALGWTLWHPFMIEMWRQNFLIPATNSTPTSSKVPDVALAQG